LLCTSDPGDSTRLSVFPNDQPEKIKQYLRGRWPSCRSAIDPAKASAAAKESRHGAVVALYDCYQDLLVAEAPRRGRRRGMILFSRLHSCRLRVALAGMIMRLPLLLRFSGLPGSSGETTTRTFGTL